MQIMSKKESLNSPDSNNRENNNGSRRLSLTVPWSLYRSLEERSSSQGRSISNLASSLLERQIGIEGQEKEG
jgi:hypothetical protein